jgi:misacylated tRNA(Ala) deacylase
MTELLYHTDSYLGEFDAMVTGVEGDAVTLDRTAFYPGGGGQPYDLGSLTAQATTWKVVKLRKAGDVVWHQVEGTPPAIGTSVHGTLDWERRYQLMRTHTAMHILCGVIFHNYGASVTGGNMEPLRGRMDFEFETMRQELVHQIEDKVNVEVAAARDVRVKILPEGIQLVRTVEIVGLDLQADGGTHVANTREVGRIRVVDYKSKGKINKRIEVAVE